MRSVKGVTFVEMIAVVVIIGLLMVSVTPFYTKRIESAKITKTQHDLHIISQAVDLYNIDTGRYPSPQEGLEALIKAPESVKKRWQGPYLKSLPTDPWDAPYQYKIPGKNTPFEVYSFGSAGQNSAEYIYSNN